MVNSYNSLPPLFRLAKGLQNGHKVAPSDDVGALPAGRLPVPSPSFEWEPTAAPSTLEDPHATPLSSWPLNVPGLGIRRVMAFTPCADCAEDPPPDDIIRVGQYTVEVPRPRGTFIGYGGRALCCRHARTRAAEAAPEPEGEA